MNTPICDEIKIKHKKAMEEESDDMNIEILNEDSEENDLDQNNPTYEAAESLLL